MRNEDDLTLETDSSTSTSTQLLDVNNYSENIIEWMDVKVNFPFPPYPTQKKYIETVVTACEEQKNALIESPTGTGKTLSLLCSSLAWQKAAGSKNPEARRSQIIYLSRTHSQLAQVVKEIRRTVYKPSSVLLASRDQYCIHPCATTMKGEELSNNCKRLRKLHGCPFYKNLHKKKFPKNLSLYDIEDMVSLGMQMEICPYYGMRELAEHAKLILMPYNYLLDHAILSENSLLHYKDSILLYYQLKGLLILVRRFLVLNSYKKLQIFGIPNNVRLFPMLGHNRK